MVHVNAIAFFLTIGILLVSSTCSDITNVKIDYNIVLQTSISTPTLQVVTNPLLAKDIAFQSPIFKQAFESLNNLNANYVRYVPWFPFPRRAVAELEPPSPASTGLCYGPIDISIYNISIDCTNNNKMNGNIIDNIVFANYGLPNRLATSKDKMCLGFQENKTCSQNVIEKISRQCVGKSICSINGVELLLQIEKINKGACSSQAKKMLAVQAKCKVPFNYTSWNFEILDPMMYAFFENTPLNSKRIPNWSTQPAWMYDTTTWAYIDNPNLNDAYIQGDSNLSQSEKYLISQYYRRLIRYYVKGGFHDEFGEYIVNPNKKLININMWEVFNEPESEHMHTAEQYTQEYDYVAAALVKEVPDIVLVGLALCRHGDSATEWLNTFLNVSNHKIIDGHKPKIDWISYHQYASCDSMDPTDFNECYFSGKSGSADAFVIEVQKHNEIKKRLAPHVKTTIDEIGTMNSGSSLPSLYWNAAASYNTYLYLKLMKENIEVIGWSQLTAYPNIESLGLEARDPSVAMLNYSTGMGNARYWVLKMMIDYTNVGDKLVETNWGNDDLYVQGFVTADGKMKTTVLVNKNVSKQNIQLDLVGDTVDLEANCQTYTVDVETGDGVPRETIISRKNLAVVLDSFAVTVLRCGAGTIRVSSTEK